MKAKFFRVLALFLVVASVLSGIVAAADVPVTIDTVKIDGDTILPDGVNRLNIERGEDMEIKVILTATDSATNVQVEAEISGYEYDHRESTSDSSRTFDVEPNTTYTKRLNVQIPDRVEEDYYKLRIMVTDRDNDEIILHYNINVDAPRHSMLIRDIILTPENEVRAGRAMLASVRVKNMGDRDEDSVKVTVSIPSLGLSASDYIDEIEEDDSETSEELYLRIPACAEEGVYDVVAEVEYDEGYEDVSKTTSIVVLRSDVCEASEGDGDEDDEEPEVPNVVVGSTLEDVVAGEGGAIYPITITNNAKSSKTFSVSVAGVEGWGTVRITPTNTMVLGAGKSEIMYVFVGANQDSPSGPQVFSVAVKRGSTTVEQVSLTANVVESEGGNWDTAKKGLEVALVVLVALLVILGLIIGFSKLKNDEAEADGLEAETYY